MECEINNDWSVFVANSLLDPILNDMPICHLQEGWHTKHIHFQSEALMNL